MPAIRVEQFVQTFPRVHFGTFHRRIRPDLVFDARGDCEVPTAFVASETAGLAVLHHPFIQVGVDFDVAVRTTQFAVFTHVRVLPPVLRSTDFMHPRYNRRRVPFFRVRQCFFRRGGGTFSFRLLVWRLCEGAERVLAVQENGTARHPSRRRLRGQPEEKPRVVALTPSQTLLCVPHQTEEADHDERDGRRNAPQDGSDGVPVQIPTGSPPTLVEQTVPVPFAFVERGRIHADATV